MKPICILGKKRSGKDSLADFVVQLEDKTVQKYSLADPIKDALLVGFYKAKLDQASGFRLDRCHLYGQNSDGSEYDRESPVNISNSDARRLFIAAYNHLRVFRNLKTTNPLLLTQLPIKDQISLICNNFKDFWNIRRMMQVLGTDIVVNHCDSQHWNRCMIDQFVDAVQNGVDYFVVPDIRQEHEINLMRAIGAVIITVERPGINNNTDSHITEAGLENQSTDKIIVNDGSLDDLKIKLLEVLKNV